MQRPDGDVARYTYVVHPVLKIILMPAADFAAAIRATDLRMPQPLASGHVELYVSTTWMSKDRLMQTMI